MILILHLNLVCLCLTAFKQHILTEVSIVSLSTSQIVTTRIFQTSSVVCTEVQYHAFNGKGDISFELTKRAGNPTLSADDIVNYYLKKKGSFDFVLLALEDTASTSHEAKIYKGEDGKNALTSLMKAETK